jgi:hypothetical protein
MIAWSNYAAGGGIAVAWLGGIDPQRAEQWTKKGRTKASVGRTSSQIKAEEPDGGVSTTPLPWSNQWFDHWFDQTNG